MPAPKPVKSSKSHNREKPTRRRDAIDLESIRSLQRGFTAFFACVSVGYDQRTEDCDYRNCCCSAAFHVLSPVAYGFPTSSECLEPLQNLRPRALGEDFLSLVPTE